MDAKFLLESVHRKYPKAAIVPELSIEDYFLEDTDEPTRALSHSSTAPPDGHKYIRRIDALMFETNIRTALEIKVTKADFMRDTYWKRRAWRNVTHRFIYVVPQGLKVSAPHGCGLWEVSECGKIEVVKKAIMNKTPEHLPQSVIQRMAYKVSNEYFNRKK